MSDEFRLLVESILEDEDMVEIATDVLLEGDSPVEEPRRELFYMMMVEQLIDDLSCYAFEGWGGGGFVGAPRINKFHVVVDMKFPKNLDTAPVRRLKGKNDENKVLFKRLDTGEILMRIRFLRSQLDEIEDRNRRIAKSKIDTVGYKQPTETPQDPAMMGDQAMDPMAQGMGGGDMFGEDPYQPAPDENFEQ